MARIGALRVDLGMNTAAFEKGADRAAREMKKMQRQIQKTGKKIQGFGKAVSIGITAPIVAAGAAFAAVANDMAREAEQMKTSAQVAGEGFEDFQRQAFAAKTVGIEFEKLGDIFKDVRDRVGDFAATGGGPMADFFENIAPKVGITADAFKGLSGKDSLQLYFDSLRKANVSQEEMVFYLEAMASDATNLIPLLEQGGKAMAELGDNATVITEEDAEGFREYTEAQREFTQAIREMTIAVVKSGILESVTELIKKVAEFASGLSKTNPKVLDFSVKALAVTAALGPFIAVIGTVVSTVATLLPLFAKMPLLLRAVGVAFRFALGPIGLILIALEAAYLVWQNWDTIGPMMKKLYEDVKKWIAVKLVDVFKKIMNPIATVKNAFFDLYDAVVGNSYVPDMVDGIEDEFKRLQKVMVDPADKATQSVKDKFRDLASDVEGILRGIFPQEALLNDLALESSRLREGLAAGLISKDTEREAQDRLRAERVAARKEQFGNAAVSGALSTGSLGDLPDLTKTFVAELQKVPQALTYAQEEMQRFGEFVGNEIMASAFDFLTGRSKLKEFLTNGLTNLFEGAIASMLKQLNNSLFGEQGIGGVLGSLLGGLFGGARAAGGPVSMGKAYLVGEKGPEIFSPSTGGKIIPNHSLGGGGGAIINVDARGSSDPEAVRMQVQRGIIEAAPSIIAASEARTIKTLRRPRLAGGFS